MSKLITVTITLYLSALGGAVGQIAVNVGPQVAPVDCPILVNVSNDTNAVLYIGALGPVRVLDAAGTLLHDFFGIPALAITADPGEAIIYYVWNQRDDLGSLVPPGAYTMEVTVNTTVTTHPLVIGGVSAAMESVGVLRPGVTRNVYLCSPQDAGFTYMWAASFSRMSGLSTCGGLIPLDPDPLLVLSTAPDNGIFFETAGTLDASGTPLAGTTLAPSISVPNAAFLSGLTFEVGFIVLDPSLSCPVVRISAPKNLTIL